MLTDKERKANKARANKAWVLANKEKNAARLKAYYKANKEKIIARTKDWNLANKEKATVIKKALNKAWYITNKKEYSAKTKDYRLANKEKIANINKAYRIANKEKVEVNNAKRRALKTNADSTMTKAEKENYANLVNIRDNATKLFGYKWSIEHIIPLTKGGTNAIDNLEVTPLSWNVSKGNRSSESFWG